MHALIVLICLAISVNGSVTYNRKLALARAHNLRVSKVHQIKTIHKSDKADVVKLISFPELSAIQDTKDRLKTKGRRKSKPRTNKKAKVNKKSSKRTNKKVKPLKRRPSRKSSRGRKRTKAIEKRQMKLIEQMNVNRMLINQINRNQNEILSLHETVLTLKHGHEKNMAIIDNLLKKLSSNATIAIKNPCAGNPCKYGTCTVNTEVITGIETDFICVCAPGYGGFECRNNFCLKHLFTCGLGDCNYGRYSASTHYTEVGDGSECECHDGAVYDETADTCVLKM